MPQWWCTTSSTSCSSSGSSARWRREFCATALCHARPRAALGRQDGFYGKGGRGYQGVRQGWRRQLPAYKQPVNELMYHHHHHHPGQQRASVRAGIARVPSPRGSLWVTAGALRPPGRCSRKVAPPLFRVYSATAGVEGTGSHTCCCPAAGSGHTAAAKGVSSNACACLLRQAALTYSHTPRQLCSQPAAHVLLSASHKQLRPRSAPGSPGDI